MGPLNAYSGTVPLFFYFLAIFLYGKEITMQNWRDWAVSCANTLDSRDEMLESKSITYAVSGESEITLQLSHCALCTTDLAIPVFTSLELKDSESTGDLTLRTNLWKWKLN